MVAAYGGDEDGFLRRSARDAAYLSREQESELSARWCRDADPLARSELVAAHQRMSIAFATRFSRGYGLPFADLVQEGNIGLMAACDKFDPAHEVRFSTYATWWVRAAIQEYALRNWSMVRFPSSAAQKKLFFGLRSLRARIEAAQGSSATRTSVTRAIAGELGMSVRTVEVALERLGPDASLNAPVGGDEDSMEVGDRLADAHASPDETAASAIDGERMRGLLAQVLSTLNPRERSIVERRKLCDVDDVVTLDALSLEFGVTRERVRQIEVNAIRKLREALSSSPLFA